MKAIRGGWLLLVVGLVAGCGGTGGAAERINQEGNRAYAAGDFRRAFDTYQRAAVERPDLAAIPYNAGNALHRLGDFDRAIVETRKAAADGDNHTRFRAYYALGNHFARLGRWREAYESYRNALVLNGDDLDAKFNLELALRRLAEQEQAQAQNRQGQQGGPQQGSPEQGQQGQANQQGDPQGAAQQGQGGGPAPQAQQAGPDQGAQPGRPTPGAQPGRSAAAIDQELKDAIARFEREYSIDDALRILDLLAEQQRLRQQQVPGPPPGTNIKDQ
jgi:tetratricopeptide (TPR) repeat protein